MTEGSKDDNHKQTLVTGISDKQDKDTDGMEMVTYNYTVLSTI